MTNEFDFITNQKLREKHGNDIEVLNKVGELQTLPNSNSSTSKQIAEFYGVSMQDINAVVNLNREEVHESGIRKAKYAPLKKRLFDVAGSNKAWREMRYNLGFSNGVTNLYQKQTVLLIGFLLEESEVAKKVRELVLENELDDLFDKTVVVEEPTIEPTVENPIQKEQYHIQTDELIKTQVNEANEIIVSGRELHEFLEAKERYSKWFYRMVGYGFDLDVDYTLYQKVHPQNNQEIIDHALKLDMAKEISMIQRNEKGKQARQYFIETEKKYKNQSVAPVASYMIDNPIERAKQWIEEQQQKMVLENKVQEQVVVIEEQEEIIENQKEIIVNYIEDIPEIEMRQKIVDIVKKASNGNGYQMSKNYNKLYKEFNMTYHRNVALLTKNYNTNNNSKLKIIHYIEDVLGMIEELYELAVKIFIIEKEERLAKMLSEVDSLLLG